MLDWIGWLFDDEPFAPRPSCGGWDETLIWVTVTADVLIWLAYMAIPFLLWQFVRTHKRDPRRVLIWLFIAFIASCGMTHFMDMLTFYQPMYRANGAMLALTAVISWVTVLALAPALPQLMALKSPEALQAEIDRRTEVEAELLKIKAELERRVELRTLELEASNADLEEFAYVASHDLQEPLRKISSFSALIAEEEGAKLGDAGREYLARMQNAAARMNTMIHDLLQLSRASARSERRRDVAFSELAKGALQDVETSLDEAGAQVVLRVAGDVHVAPMGITQVLSNLIGNAVKYRRKEVPLRIEISTRPADVGMLEVTVSDNGIGFDPQYSEQIFKPFERLHTREQFPGTGIGLALCRKIVERHGGRISAQGTPGEGATFRFTVPAAK